MDTTCADTELGVEQQLSGRGGIADDAASARPWPAHRELERRPRQDRVRRPSRLDPGAGRLCRSDPCDRPRSAEDRLRPAVRRVSVGPLRPLVEQAPRTASDAHALREPDARRGLRRHGARDLHPRAARAGVGHRSRPPRSSVGGSRRRQSRSAPCSSVWPRSACRTAFASVACSATSSRRAAS